MAGEAEEKRPSETRRLQADFASALLSSEQLIEANCDVVVTNVLTDEDVTTAILVSGSLEVVGTLVRGRFGAGTAGETYEVRFSSGETTYGNDYDGSINLVVTDRPAADNLYTSLDEVKTRLSIPTSDTSVDDILEQLIVSASDYARNRLGRELLLRKYTSRVDLEQCGTEIWLSEYPVLKIDTIRLITADGLDVTTPDAATYDFTEEGSVFFRHSHTFYPHPSYNEVVFRAGYVKLPGDIREAVGRVATILYRVRGREGLSLERIGEYMWQATKLTDLPSHLRAELGDPFVEAVFARHKRRDIGIDVQPARRRVVV
jgi:hypothetical protein